ncbi:MAG: hypothetical protein ABIN08_01205 [Caldimonas sp.]
MQRRCRFGLCRYAFVQQSTHPRVNFANLDARRHTAVGVLIEVPVMLLVVRVVNRSKAWYEAGAGVQAS